MREYEPLSSSRIAKAEATNRDIWLADSDGRRGFGRLVLRISPRGARHFYFKYCANGVRRVIPLGPYSKDSKPNHLTLGQAREAAQRVLHTLRLQAQPSPTAHAQPDATVASLQRPTRTVGSASQPAPSPPIDEIGEGTLDDLCTLYVQHLKDAGKVSAEETRKRLDRHLTGTPLGLTAAARVSPKEIAAHLRVLVSANKGRTAGQLRANIGAAFELALSSETNPSISGDWGRFRITTNPVRNVASLSQYSKPRMRTLTTRELGFLWPLLLESIANEGPSQFADRFIRLNLLLGGQRCQQLVRAKTVDLDLDEGVLTILDWKGRRTDARVHRVPVSDHALPDLRWFLALAKDLKSEYLFPGRSDPGSAVNLDTISTRVSTLSRNLKARYGVPPFSYSDFRRTTQTGMAALGIRLEVVNQILSHGLGGIVARHYNFHEYKDEMLEALDKWGNHLAALVAQPAEQRP